VHKNLLTQVSPYFRAALKKDFQEALDRKIDLPHVKADTMERFIDWLYTGKLEIAEIDEKFDGGTYKRQQELVDLYVFADAHDVPSLRMAAIDELFDYFNHPTTLLPAKEEITSMFAQFPPSSALLKLIVDVDCRYHVLYDGETEAEEKSTSQTLPPEFLASAYTRHCYVMGKIVRGDWKLRYKLCVCDYHEHADQKERDECPRNEES
jgi:hypothetical protein